MRKLILFFLFLLPMPVKAAGPILLHKEPEIQREFQNVYDELRGVSLATSSVQPGSTFYINNTGSSSNTAAFISSLTVQNINGTFIGLGRNRIINGDMFWDQRNEGSAVTLVANTNTFGCDRFFGYNRGFPGKWTQQRVTVSPPAPFSYNLKVAITSATLFIASSETATAEYVTSTRIEGPNWSDSGFGTTSASTVTVSFWVRTSSVGYYGFSLESTSSNPDTYPTHYYIPVANIWTPITLIFPPDTSGPWAFGQGLIGLKLIWDHGSGTDFQKISSSWYGGSGQEYNRLINDNRIVTVLGVTWELTGVQVELGSQATKFEFVPVQNSYFNVTRYYRKSYQRGTVPGSVISTGRISLGWFKVGAAASKSSTYQFAPQMAIDPNSCTYYSTDGTQGSWLFTDIAGVSANAVITNGDTQKDGFFLNAASTQLFGQGHFACDGEL